jgi:uncharacterized surface protein with fasciclin (FAS1) repeats
VVSGKWDSKALADKIKNGHGMALISTVQGGMIRAMMKGGKMMPMDEKGNTATMNNPDVYQSNGAIFVIDRVLMPK